MAEIKSNSATAPSEESLSDRKLFEVWRAILSNGAAIRFRAGGYSMSPLIRHGDVVTVMPFTSTAPSYGSVVAFERPDTHGISVHRIVGRRRSCFLLKGDACLSSDGFVPSTKILGRVSRLERKGKRKRLGLGWERYLIAILTRWGLLQGLLGATRYRLADSRKRGHA